MYHFSYVYLGISFILNILKASKSGHDPGLSGMACLHHDKTARHTARVLSRRLKVLGPQVIPRMLWFVIAVVVYSLSYVQLFATPWTIARQAPLPITVSMFAEIRVH